MSYTNRVLVNLTAFIAVLVVNYLSNALPLNGKTPGELSDDYPNLFVPAGLTFSIWGIIYLCLLAWNVLQIVGLFSTSLRAKIEPALQKSSWLFPATCALNIAWIFAWHWHFVALSVLVMIGLLWTLLLLNIRAGTGRSAADGLEKWVAHAGFGLYQGWITVALIANVTALLVSQGFAGGAAAQFWAAGMVLIGGALATWMVLKTNNIFHGVAVAWALYGIYLKRDAAGDAASMTVAWTAVALLVVVLVAVSLRIRAWVRYA
jgi:hypothetical protein